MYDLSQPAAYTRHIKGQNPRLGGNRVQHGNNSYRTAGGLRPPAPPQVGLERRGNGTEKVRPPLRFGPKPPATGLASLRPNFPLSSYEFGSQ